MHLREWFTTHAGPGEFSGQWLADEPLSRHTYYRIGGPAAILASPRTRADVKLIHRALHETGASFFILGFGSNVLASDEGFRGVVIRTRNLETTIEMPSPELIRTGAGVAITTLLRRCSEEGWGGLEFLTGIPGSVGGAVRMNGGTHLGESGSRLVRVEACSLRTGAVREITGDGLRFQYRKNLFLEPDELVLSADWRIDTAEPAKVKALVDETLVRRKATQPLDAPSCGSVFKNPKEAGLQAWQVIDRLGLRGHRIGNAQISEKHPNWILNLGGARSVDVQALIDLVRRRALDELGVRMEEEVVRLGNER